MRRQVWNYMMEQNMPVEGTGIVAGVSGGADSLCLLALLQELSLEKGFGLQAVHVHHGLRGEEADRDADYVRQFCRELSVPVTVFYEDAAAVAEKRKMTVEEAGRYLRYERFLQEARRLGYGCIAVAHHQNDNAETMLFQMARGSGLKGLSGIPACRPLEEVMVIRPLLSVSRQQIEEYLAERKISYCVDSTNLDNDYTRNIIRNEILPVLEQKVNLQAVSHMGQTAEQLAEIWDYMEAQTREALEQCMQQDGGDIVLDVEQFGKHHRALQKQMLSRVLGMAAGSRKDFTAVHVEQLSELFGKETGRRIYLPRGLTAEKKYEKVVLHCAGRTGENDGIANLKLTIPGRYPLPDGRWLKLSVKMRKNGRLIPKTSCIKWFDYDKISDVVFLRCPQQGDYYYFGAECRRKNLNRYFIDRKVPRDERASQLLLAEGSHVLWILGDRISEYYKVSDGTKRILIAEIAEY